MEEARAAISKVTGRQGHTTEVDETVRGGITQEQVKPHQHEEQTKAVDREVHQHHHHTTIQPIQDRQVLPEKHSHQMMPTEERSFNHGNEEETQRRLEKERAQFQDTSRTEATTRSEAQAPTVMGERVHHHVHETVQPVVDKETVAPEVVHTTKPIHEKHLATGQVHGTSVLPTKTMGDFQSSGGDLSGGSRTSQKVEEYAGVPKQYNKEMIANPTEADTNPSNMGVEGPGSHHTGGTGLSDGQPFTDNNEGHRVMHEGAGHGTGGGSGLTGTGQHGHHHGHHHEQDSSRLGESTTGRETDNYSNGNTLGRDIDNQSGTTGSNTRGTDGLPSTNARPGAGEYAGTGTATGGSYNTSSSQSGTGESAASRYAGEKEGIDTTKDDQYGSSATGKKPSLMDKLNPMKDSNGDGQKGFMK